MPRRGGSWLFTTKSPEMPGTHSIDIEEEKSGKAKTFKFLTIEKHILLVGSRIKSSHGKWQVGLLIEHSSAIVHDSWYEHLIKWLPVQIIVFVENGANWKHKYHWLYVLVMSCSSPVTVTSITEYLYKFLARLINTYKLPNPWNVNNWIFFTMVILQQQKLGIYRHYWPHDWFHCKLHPTWRFLTTWKIYLEKFDLFYILRVDFKCTRSSKVCWFNKLFAAMIPWKCYKMIAIEKVYQNSNSEAMKPTY